MSLWARLLAAGYDPVMASAERHGIADARRALLAGAEGRVLEIGAGTGLNVPHYPAKVEVTYLEPDRHMARRLRARGVDVVGAPGEELPFPDASFETAVSTLVLCSVDDVPRVLGELRRVLVPGGRLLYLEHVRAPEGSRRAGWQDRLNRPWHAVSGGCNCNRDLGAALARASWAAEATTLDWAFMPKLLRPVVAGAATPVEG